jgi:hypothetical protein
MVASLAPVLTRASPQSLIITIFGVMYRPPCRLQRLSVHSYYFRVELPLAIAADAPDDDDHARWFLATRAKYGSNGFKQRAEVDTSDFDLLSEYLVATGWPDRINGYSPTEIGQRSHFPENGAVIRAGF